MILYQDCDLINLNTTECEECYRYDICKESIGIKKENNMNEYIFISSAMCGNDTTAMKIIATNEKQALSKAYLYFSGDSKLPVEDFNILVEHTSIQRIYRLFKDFTGQMILYLCEETDTGIIDDLQGIDIIKRK